ncbi:MAG: hypothetical protein MUO41_12435 [Methyloceanibacter sp.]|nr:hypothetical protein [Methyloceanibacter sp.]
MEFSIKSALNFGWETFKRRPWFFVGATLVIFLLYIVAGALTVTIDYALTGVTENHSGVGSILDWLIGTLISMGVVAFYLKAHDNPEQVTLSALWHPHPYWSYLAATVLVGLVIVLGLLLLIVPGIIFGLMFMFTSFIVIDRAFGPIDAMKESKRITSGYRWRLLGFILLLALINLAGVIALVVGLLVTVPVTSIAFANAYRVLSDRAGVQPIPPDAALTHTT